MARALQAVDAVMFTTLTLDSATSLNPVMSLTGHPSIAVRRLFAVSGGREVSAFVQQAQVD